MEGDHANVRNDPAQFARNLGDVLASGFVVVLIDVGARKTTQPLVEIRRPLACAAGIGGADQSERGESVGVLLAFADFHGRV